VKAHSNGPKCVRSTLAADGHARRVAPPADAGFTMTSGRLLIRSRRFSSSI
jgi:hypothetical protein